MIPRRNENLCLSEVTREVAAWSLNKTAPGKKTFLPSMLGSVLMVPKSLTLHIWLNENWETSLAHFFTRQIVCDLRTFFVLFLVFFGYCRGTGLGSCVHFPDVVNNKGHIFQGGLWYSLPDCKLWDYPSNKIELNVMLSLGLVENN